jgi:hypothetical protein
MTDARRCSAPWLTAAAALFVADLFLHLPITDICDALVKKYGFYPFDGFIRRGFEAAGAACLCGAWMWPRRGRTVVGMASLTLMGIVAAAQMLIVLNGVEDVHYPQYALLTCVLARGLPTLEGAWLGGTILGAVDEGYQFLALPRGTPGYFDWNDVVLNAIGSAFGIVIAVMLVRRSSQGELLSRRRALLIACAAVAAAIILAPPILRPFFDVTPGGRRFHKMAGWEAMAVVAALWSGVRYLVARAASERSPNLLTT